MVKRGFDILASIGGIVILSPVFLILAVWITLDSSGPIFFRQERVGLRGKIFRIHKFRSMQIGAEKHGQITIGSDSRITTAGQFIRKYKLDELPQLLDVLYGDMSIVGPRPEVAEYMNLYEDNVREKILSVRPGITDYASIEMVDENQLLAKFDDPSQAYVRMIMPIKQEYYLKYVENNTFLGDIVIILKTIRKVALRSFNQ